MKWLHISRRYAFALINIWKLRRKFVAAAIATPLYIPPPIRPAHLAHSPRHRFLAPDFRPFRRDRVPRRDAKNAPELISPVNLHNPRARRGHAGNSASSFKSFRDSDKIHGLRKFTMAERHFCNFVTLCDIHPRESPRDTVAKFICVTICNVGARARACVFWHSISARCNSLNCHARYFPLLCVIN